MNIALCEECKELCAYRLTKKSVTKTIRGKQYTFSITVAICHKCGKEINVPGLIDKNVQEIDEQYRSDENIVTTKDMKTLMTLYDIGKGPLSIALGFGEVTLARYLQGQIPSKEYSDIMKKALSSPTYMKKKLIENKAKIAPSAYKKAERAVTKLEVQFSISDTMRQVLWCIFNNLEEVTPLMLQKLLYFIQGVSLGLNQSPMFEEDCEAWVHGPVYPSVYSLFQDFKYNPIDDDRFVILKNTKIYLTDSQKHIIDSVTRSFGAYSGKTLESITHKESPWLSARKGYSDGIPSREVISQTSMAVYFEKQHHIYDFNHIDGLNNYIQDMIHKEFS